MVFGSAPALSRTTCIRPVRKLTLTVSLSRVARCTMDRSYPITRKQPSCQRTLNVTEPAVQ
ncbi:hypothetical protein BXU09_18495, partial [Deinococcus sp. LM3]